MLSHDQLVEVYNAIFRAVFEYASQVFINPGAGLDTRLRRICKRAYKIIHGNDHDCHSCGMLDIISRRMQLAMRLFVKAKSDERHILHDLLPRTSNRSNRLILPTIRTSRRAKGFIFSCSMRDNENL